MYIELPYVLGTFDAGLCPFESTSTAQIPVSTLNKDAD
jgi:hypothetical protein